MLIPETWHESWDSFMTNKIKDMITDIENKITGGFYPEKQNVLRFLNNDMKNIKYVIVGMEPYPSSFIKDGVEIPVATGRSFEVANVTSWQQKFKQSSLRNILKTVYYTETGDDIKLDDIRKKISEGSFNMAEPKDWFDNLEEQGVLFLNATLTVQPGKVDTHTSIWEDFMNELIKYIDSNTNCKWMLWGAKAKERILPIVDVNKTIQTCHPRLAGFVKENCFGKASDIDWTGSGLYE